ncbi:MAG: hypothetical protein ACRC62_14645 [Microcoleus sp.]
MSTNYILPTADACFVVVCTPSHQVYQRRGSVRAPAVAQFVLTFASLSLESRNLAVARSLRLEVALGRGGSRSPESIALKVL